MIFAAKWQSRSVTGTDDCSSSTKEASVPQTRVPCSARSLRRRAALRPRKKPPPARSPSHSEPATAPDPYSSREPARAADRPGPTAPTHPHPHPHPHHTTATLLFSATAGKEKRSARQLARPRDTGRRTAPPIRPGRGRSVRGVKLKQPPPSTVTLTPSSRPSTSLASPAHCASALPPRLLARSHLPPACLLQASLLASSTSLPRPAAGGAGRERVRVRARGPPWGPSSRVAAAAVIPGEWLWHWAGCIAWRFPAKFSGFACSCACLLSASSLISLAAACARFRW
nr:unnamed protein product [Digitaria exilis]